MKIYQNILTLFLPSSWNLDKNFALTGHVYTVEYDDYLNEYLEDDPVTYRMTADAGTSEEEEKQMPIALKESLFDKLKVQLFLIRHLNKFM